MLPTAGLLLEFMVTVRWNTAKYYLQTGNFGLWRVFQASKFN